MDSHRRGSSAAEDVHRMDSPGGRSSAAENMRLDSSSAQAQGNGARRYQAPSCRNCRSKSRQSKAGFQHQPHCRRYKAHGHFFRHRLDECQAPAARGKKQYRFCRHAKMRRRHLCRHPLRHLPYTVAGLLYYSRGDRARSRQAGDDSWRHEAHAGHGESSGCENAAQTRQGQCR